MSTRPDPNAAFPFYCNRCDRLNWSRTITTECVSCITAAQRVWPDLWPYIGRLKGGMSGG